MPALHSNCSEDKAYNYTSKSLFYDITFHELRIYIRLGQRMQQFDSPYRHHVGACSARLRKPSFVRAGFSSSVLRSSSFTPSKHASLGTRIGSPQTLATPAFAGFLRSRNPLRQPVFGSEFAGLQIRVFQEVPCTASVVSSSERIAFADAALEL